MNLNAYMELVVSWFMTGGIRIVFVLLVTMIALKIVRAVASRFSSLVTKSAEEDLELQKRAQTLGSVTRYALTLVVLVVSAMTVLRELGIEIAPVLAAAGVVGLAVGFGAQNLVQDVISGFFILLDDQIRVGDIVEVGGKGGLVEQVNLRMVVLRDVAGNVHYVRNGQIDVVTNLTKGYSRYVFDIGVAYREDVDEVTNVLREVDEELRQDPEFTDLILEPLEVMGLNEFGDSAVVIRARTKTRPQQQWRVGREFNRRLKKKFDERNIEIPFPHVTLYMGQDKQGQSPPVRVNLEGVAR